MRAGPTGVLAVWAGEGPERQKEETRSPRLASAQEQADRGEVYAHPPGKELGVDPLVHVTRLRTRYPLMLVRGRNFKEIGIDM